MQNQQFLAYLTYESTLKKFQDNKFKFLYYYNNKYTLNTFAYNEKMQYIVLQCVMFVLIYLFFLSMFRIRIIVNKYRQKSLVKFRDLLIIFRTKLSLILNEMFVQV